MVAEQEDSEVGIHVAIIMDGNGRWATRQGLPRIAGHRAGAAAVRRIVQHAADIGIARLTLYAFSSDNWRRPGPEVQSIFWLLRVFLRTDCERLRDQDICFRVIGRRDRLSMPVLRAIEKTEARTEAGRRLLLQVAVDYSSRETITRVALDASADLMRTGATQNRLRPLLSQALTAHNADVDLLIRTGGEQRLSDFLLWESAYAELLFTNTMWPDFSAVELEAALKEFHGRDRRFGGVNDDTVNTSSAWSCSAVGTEKVSEQFLREGVELAAR